jgi:hypothetical protein
MLTWNAMGVWVDFDPGTDNVLWIGTEARGSGPWAEYSTAEAFASARGAMDVLAAMGAPERTVSAGGLTSLYYDSRGLRLTCRIQVLMPKRFARYVSSGRRFRAATRSSFPVDASRASRWECRLTARSPSSAAAIIAARVRQDFKSITGHIWR